MELLALRQDSDERIPDSLHVQGLKFKSSYKKSRTSKFADVVHVL